MPELGQKRTFAPHKVMSAFGGKADMCGAIRDVRFRPIADILFKADFARALAVD